MRAVGVELSELVKGRNYRYYRWWPAASQITMHNDASIAKFEGTVDDKYMFEGRYVGTGLSDTGIQIVKFIEWTWERPDGITMGFVSE